METDSSEILFCLLWKMVMININPLLIRVLFFKGHVDRNLGTRYNTLLLRFFPDLLNVCPLRQFHTLPSLLESQAALINFYPNALVSSREAVCTICMIVYCMTQPGHEPTTCSMRGGHPNH